MSSINLRTLTRKSKIGFGKHRHKTVQFMLDDGKHTELASMYYKLSKISFMPDILDEIGIAEENRINKPSTDEAKYYELFGEERTKQLEKHYRKDDAAKKYRPKDLPLSKSRLRFLNNKKR